MKTSLDLYTWRLHGNFGMRAGRSAAGCRESSSLPFETLAMDSTRKLHVAEVVAMESSSSIATLLRPVTKRRLI